MSSFWNSAEILDWLGKQDLKTIAFKGEYTLEAFVRIKVKLSVPEQNLNAHKCIVYGWNALEIFIRVADSDVFKKGTQLCEGWRVK